MISAIDDESIAPRSFTSHFLRPPAPGKVEIDVVIERVGRTVTSASARMWQSGELMLLSLGAFGRPFVGDTEFSGTPMPDVGPPPAEMPPFVVPEGVWLPPVAHRFRLVPCIGAHPSDRGGDVPFSGGWMRLDDPAPLDSAALVFYSDGWAPTPFMMLDGFVLAPTVELTVQFRETLPHAGTDELTPILGRFQTNRSAEGYFVEDGELWAPDGTLLALSRQLGCLLPVSP
jgi:acyl-CoA thioesterase